MYLFFSSKRYSIVFSDKFLPVKVSPMITGTSQYWSTRILVFWWVCLWYSVLHWVELSPGLVRQHLPPSLFYFLHIVCFLFVFSFFFFNHTKLQYGNHSFPGIIGNVINIVGCFCFHLHISLGSTIIKRLVYRKGFGTYTCRIRYEISNEFQAAGINLL